MSQEDNPTDLQPVPRDDLLFDLRFALKRAIQSRRARRPEYDYMDFQIMAKAVLEQLELSRTRFFRPPPRINQFNRGRMIKQSGDQFTLTRPLVGAMGGAPAAIRHALY